MRKFQIQRPLSKNKGSNSKGTNNKNDTSPVDSILNPEYCETVRNQSYIGKKGYTVPKCALSVADLEFLKKDLFVRPEVMGARFGPKGGDNDSAFPVYRENEKKMYLPRFYGVSRYGLPDRSEIQSGKDIDTPFVKPLRDYQDKIVDVYMKYVDSLICKMPDLDAVNISAKGNGGILEVPCGRGKCLGKDTPILMYDGSIKMVQDIQVGDVLMGDDSGPRNVLSLARGRETMIEIQEDKKDSGYVTNMSHILSLKNRVTGEVSDLSVQEYLSHPGRDDLFGYRVPIQFREKTTDRIDPYTYGVSFDKYSGLWVLNRYRQNTRVNQLELLAGFMDKMHSDDKKQYGIHLPKTAWKLRDSIAFVARAIGFQVNIEDFDNVIHIVLKTTIHANLREIPTRICKLEQFYPSALDEGELTYKIKPRVLGEDDYYGFEIDGNHRFVLGDFTVTHNTVMALKIISLLKKKTLIIVHKEFLMNQWIERAAEFIPSARIGKIQGSVVDIHNKDIVIGMVQSLYDKDYPASIFEEFGLTIVDEVHRICSEQFSRTLFKTITPCMLGISATVDRKDKLTRVLHMFIGDKIYSEQRENDDVVCVRAIEYKSTDPEFNEVELDFRGSPKYSTMISKLCEYGPRSDFIVRILRDLLEESPENQIMVLCHNRSLLAYLYQSIQHKSLTSVGYYVGGMKQTSLQETEKKQIVLATYAMAAEALDIKTLSTLVMVTPKTDITQSVGRILRMKHENPIIVDIVDTHELFQNQWIQRRRFYKKCNYRIRWIDSANYKGFCFDWNVDTTWKRVYEPKDKQGTDASTCAEKDDDEDQTSASSGGIGKLLINVAGLGLDLDH
jgi:superfamily II DNA or RNA helicase